ncbi:hypothetical protein CMI47_05695 [Candidatus Pacearchaeota archaeon]|nr:hypothetical protein [Candidatus Pacearchaeota archaeon]
MADDISGPGDKADCGHPNPIWFADNELWNAVMGGDGATDDPGGVLCPTCFMLKAGEVLRVSRTASKADSALVGELVPCPFCGDTEPYLEPTGTNFRIACSNPDCAASGPSGPSEGCAVGAWNGAALALNRAADALAALSDRDVVLEEAAKKIDQRASYHGDQDQGPRRQAAWKEARECAATIRALKGGVDE